MVSADLTRIGWPATLSAAEIGVTVFAASGHVDGYRA